MFKGDCSLGGIATQELKGEGKFTLPGLCMIKTRKKPATKATKRMMFGKETVVKPLIGTATSGGITPIGPRILAPFYASVWRIGHGVYRVDLWTR